MCQCDNSTWDLDTHAHSVCAGWNGKALYVRTTHERCLFFSGMYKHHSSSSSSSSFSSSLTSSLFLSLSCFTCVMILIQVKSYSFISPLSPFTPPCRINCLHCCYKSTHTSLDAKLEHLYPEVLVVVSGCKFLSLSLPSFLYTTSHLRIQSKKRSPN